VNNDLCAGRVVIVTGAGRGIGAAHALEFARHGARVVVNDLGCAPDGTGRDPAPAAANAEQIRAAGGEAIANDDDVADDAGAHRLIGAALDAFGRVDTLVNNAGGLRDRMFVNMSTHEWDDVLRMNLRGHFCPARHAAAYWRDRAKTGERVDARIVNTSSGAGLMGSVGQANYGAAKAAIAALTLIQAAELARYGVTVNAIAPSARTRLTESVFPDLMATVDGGFDAMAPDNIAPLVVWLGSGESGCVTGRVFEVAGGSISVSEGWQHGPAISRCARWDPREVGAAVGELLAKARTPAPVYGA
jgi:NAD(P)-dependent dehydrogenase (short-subunit alcohol dehydrogenase family)